MKTPNVRTNSLTITVTRVAMLNGTVRTRNKPMANTTILTTLF